jgi:hypothetical protein
MVWLQRPSNVVPDARKDCIVVGTLVCDRNVRDFEDLFYPAT